MIEYLAIGVLVVILGLTYLMRHVIGGMFGLYRVVPVNEAHIRIMNNKKTIFSSRTGKSAYWRIPFITKLHKLPLTNLSIQVNDIKLNDSNMAKFICDLMCFINIDNLELAAERLTLTDTRDELGFDFTKLSEELRAIMESIGRTVTTKQTVIEIYMNRDYLDNAITTEVKKVFPAWGIALVDLELKDIKDAGGSTIIEDIERKSAAEIHRDAIIKVAEMERDSAIKVAEAERLTKIAQAAAAEEYRKKEIERDKNISISQQDAQIDVAKRAALANEERVKAENKLQVGQAEIAREVMRRQSEGNQIRVELEATAQANATRKIAEGEAEATRSTGNASAAIILATKLAEAEGTAKLAEAMAKFDEKALGVKSLDVQQTILVAKFQALAKIASEAEIKWIMSGANAQSFFGLDLTAEGGANLDQFFENNPIAKTLLEKLGGVSSPSVKSILKSAK